MTRFVVVCFARTGSSWLCQLLDSHPSILCHGEVFNRQGIGYTPTHIDDLARPWSVTERDADPSRFAQELFADARGHQAVGFKLLNWHQPGLLDDLVRDPDVHKVILRRENRIRVFLSRSRAEVSGGYRRTNYDGLRVRLEPEALLAFVKRYDKFYLGLHRGTAGSPAHFVVYERLGEPAYRAEIVDFLGVSPREAPLHAVIPRQSSDPLREAIANFDELADALAGTSLRAELDE